MYVAVSREMFVPAASVDPVLFLIVTVFPEIINRNCGTVVSPDTLVLEVPIETPPLCAVANRSGKVPSTVSPAGRSMSKQPQNMPVCTTNPRLVNGRPCRLIFSTFNRGGGDLYA